MLKNISFVSLAFLYSNILGYIFHFYVSRKLGPVLYGEFMVLYSLMLTIFNLCGILGTVAVKFLVESKDGEKVFNYFRRLGVITGFIISIVGVVISPYLQKLLKIDKIYYFLPVSAAWLLAFIVTIERSYLQANNRFGKLSLSSALELTMRLVFVIGVLNFGIKLFGVLMASVVGLIASLLYLFVENRVKVKIKFKQDIPFKRILITAAYISPAGFLVYADTLFIRRIFDSYTAGIFSSISIFGKAVALFCISAFTVLFPVFVKFKESDKRKLYILLIKALIFLTFYFIIVELVIFLCGKEIYNIAFGKKFSIGFSYLWIYIASMYPLTLSILFINVLTAIQKFISVIYIHLFLVYGLFMFFMIIKPVSVYHYIISYLILNFMCMLTYITYIFKINDA